VLQIAWQRREQRRVTIEGVASLRRGRRPRLVFGDFLSNPMPMNQPLPPYVEEVYEFLKNEVTWLHARWVVFEQLYNKSPLRLELLNETAPSFFHLLQLLMFDDLQLSLSRLTDPAPFKASLLQLQKRLESHANAKLAATAKETLESLTKAVEAIRGRRDNQIAHYSLQQATSPHAERLPDVYHQNVTQCLQIVRDYMNLIELHYHGKRQGYEYFAWQDDADTLATVLKWGIRHRDLMLAQEVSIHPRQFTECRGRMPSLPAKFKFDGRRSNPKAPMF
jgi:hypothetical protein